MENVDKVVLFQKDIINKTSIVWNATQFAKLVMVQPKKTVWLVFQGYIWQCTEEFPNVLMNVYLAIIKMKKRKVVNNVKDA